MSSDDEGLEDISPHIRIRIDPKQKNEWLEYAEEHHHGNLNVLGAQSDTGVTVNSISVKPSSLKTQ